MERASTSVVRTLTLVDHPSSYCVLNGFEHDEEGLNFAEFSTSEAENAQKWLGKLKNIPLPTDGAYSDYIVQT